MSSHRFIWTPVFAILLLTGGLVVTAFGEKPAAVREFGPATLIEGKPRDRGIAYGKAFRAEIGEFLDKEIYAAFVGKSSSKEDLLAYGVACGKLVREECPMVAEEFAGIAEGAGLKFEEVMLINLHEELYHRVAVPKPPAAPTPAGGAAGAKEHRPDRGVPVLNPLEDRHHPVGMVLPSNSLPSYLLPRFEVSLAPLHGHCTAVAVGPPDTGDKHTYVGQTWDWMQSVAGKSRMTEWRREDGVSVLAYGFPGMPAGAGVSASGIALCWTSAALGDKSLAPRVGIPSYVLIAHLLAQKNMDDVIREAKKNKHAGWFTFVMADGEGRLVNIEGSPQRVVIEEAKGRLARVLYGSREMTGAKPEAKVALHARCQLMYDHLEATRGRNDLARLQDYFENPKHKINVGVSTIDMMVFDATTRKAYLSRGTSYGVTWRQFEVKSKD